MKILIVDNETIRLDKLRELLSKNEVETILFSEINFEYSQNFDLIILSGGSNHSVIGNNDLYNKELELIKKSKKPIIGICLGFQLICYAFGAFLSRLETKEHGFIEIKTTLENDIFSNLLNPRVYESHKWVAKKEPKDFILLATSIDGVEAIKHKSKDIYGFQFHPEMFVNETSGDEILFSVINKIKNNY